MGLFGGAGKGGGGLFSGGLGGFFDRLGQGAHGAQMALAGDYAGLASLQQQRARIRAAQEETEEERRQRAVQIESASQLVGPGGEPLFTKAQLNAMSTQDLSQLTREIFSPVNRGPEGGVTSTRDPRTGLQRHERSPGRITDEGRIIDIDANGNARTSFDARENDVRWETGAWGAFATDRSGRPVAPGTDIRSPMGQAPGAPPAQAPVNPGAPPVAQPQPGISPTSALDPNTIFGRMIQQESRGQQFDRNGRPLRSPKGAIGIAQVMPGTGPEAAALAGLPWDPQRLRSDPQYNATLGRAYFQRQLETFGDPILAAAAYNAGPNRVRNALRRGGENWQAHVPAETRNYVRTVFGEGARGTQTAQASVPNIPGQGRNVQEQAAGGFVTAPQQAPPGYRWSQDGNLEPITGGPGDQSREDRQEVRQVLNTFNSDPEVRQFRQARIATMQINNLGQSGRPADDVAMIFSFMRALDPNSTVREGEFATAQNTAGIPDRIRNYYNQARQGTLLSPQQRRDFQQTGISLYMDRARSYNEVANNYREQLQAMGVPGDQIARLVQTAEGPQRQDRERQRQAQQDRGPLAIGAQIEDAMNRITQPRVRILSRRPR